MGRTSMIVYWRSGGRAHSECVMQVGGEIPRETVGRGPEPEGGCRQLQPRSLRSRSTRRKDTVGAQKRDDSVTDVCWAMIWALTNELV